MSRLTKKNNGTGSWTQFGDKYLPAHNIKHKQCVNKLGQLEDIEEELGMELKVYHKLMNMLYCGKKYPNILYVKDKDTIVQVGILEIDYCKKKIIFYKDKSYNEDYVYAFIQYGKTFALTREELNEAI